MARLLEYFPEPCQDPMTECVQCEAEIYYNEEVVLYDGEIFCSDTCVTDRVNEEMHRMTVEEAMEVIA